MYAKIKEKESAYTNYIKDFLGKKDSAIRSHINMEMLADSNKLIKF